MEFDIKIITIFILAIFIGFELISKVPPTLHTPLMSASNAISGITVIGAIIITGTIGAESKLIMVLGFLALIFSSINVFGGYSVTNIMFGMLVRGRKTNKKTKNKSSTES